eukprot:GHUV01023936.1.p1 GENE.GHUV01023936.1~~GHUV01023936.1.p1  ORF type:complete len:173 (-),score=69.69 GHUV01023936.1:379-897(-)
MQEEKKGERRKRGNPDTYTTDARFDEGFQLGHGLTGPKPWYARAADPTIEQQWEQIAQHQQQKRLKQQQHMLALPAAVVANGHDHSSKQQRSKRRRSSSTSSDRGSGNSDSSVERSRKRTKYKSSSRRHSSKQSRHKRTHKKEKVCMQFHLEGFMWSVMEHLTAVSTSIRPV